MGIPAIVTSIISNIIHKKEVELYPLIRLDKAFREHNRKRIYNNITANNTYVNVWVAPYTGKMEDIWVSAPAQTTSTSGSNVTITLSDLTQGTTLLSWNSYTNSLDFPAANTGIEIFTAVGISPSTGTPVSTFNAGDVLELKIQVVGTPGITSSSVLATLLGVTSTDPSFNI